MAKKISIIEQKTMDARPWRWQFVANDNARDETVPVGTKRLDCIVYYKDNAIPQRKKRDVFAGLPPGQKLLVRNFLEDISDSLLEAHATEQGLATETDTEDVLE